MNELERFYDAFRHLATVNEYSDIGAQELIFLKSRLEKYHELTLQFLILPRGLKIHIYQQQECVKIFDEEDSHLYEFLVLNEVYSLKLKDGIQIEDLHQYLHGGQKIPGVEKNTFRDPYNLSLQIFDNFLGMIIALRPHRNSLPKLSSEEVAQTILRANCQQLQLQIRKLFSFHDKVTFLISYHEKHRRDFRIEKVYLFFDEAETNINYTKAETPRFTEVDMPNQSEQLRSIVLSKKNFGVHLKSLLPSLQDDWVMTPSGENRWDLGIFTIEDDHGQLALSYKDSANYTLQFVDLAKTIYSDPTLSELTFDNLAVNTLRLGVTDIAKIHQEFVHERNNLIRENEELLSKLQRAEHFSEEAHSAKAPQNWQTEKEQLEAKNSFLEEKVKKLEEMAQEAPNVHRAFQTLQHVSEVIKGQSVQSLSEEVFKGYSKQYGIPLHILIQNLTDQQIEQILSKSVDISPWLSQKVAQYIEPDQYQRTQRTEEPQNIHSPESLGYQIDPFIKNKSSRGLAQKIYEEVIFPNIPGYKFEQKYFTSENPGGDALFICNIDQYSWGIGLFDILGTGYENSLRILQLQTLFKNLILQEKENLLVKLNEAILDFKRYDRSYPCFDALVGFLDTRHNCFSYQRAGMPFVFRSNSNGLEILNPLQGTPKIGIPVQQEMYIAPYQKVNLNPDDQLIFYTNGLLKKFDGEEKLMQQIVMNGLSEVTKSLENEAYLKDDIYIFTIHRSEKN